MLRPKYIFKRAIKFYSVLLLTSLTYLPVQALLQVQNLKPRTKFRQQSSEYSWNIHPKSANPIYFSPISQKQKTCSVDSDCPSGLKCYDSNFSALCSPDSESCFCVNSCDGPGDCPAAHFCATAFNGTLPVCFTCDSILVEPYNGDECEEPVLASCTSEADCANHLTCINTSNAQRCGEADDGDRCVCIRTCSSSKDCPGAMCATFESSVPMCLGCDSMVDVKPVDENENCKSNGSSEPCVDANLLSHLPANQLVFAKHRRASVLCDESGSCATSGHIVTHNGRVMMMGSYCHQYGVCTRKVMEVNSPRMTRRVRIDTKTKNLLFTAFSARHETRAEETLLSILIHLESYM